MTTDKKLTDIITFMATRFQLECEPTKILNDWKGQKGKTAGKKTGPREPRVYDVWRKEQNADREAGKKLQFSELGKLWKTISDEDKLALKERYIKDGMLSASSSSSTPSPTASTSAKTDEVEEEEEVVDKETYRQRVKDAHPDWSAQRVGREVAKKFKA